MVTDNHWSLQSSLQFDSLHKFYKDRRRKKFCDINKYIKLSVVRQLLVRKWNKDFKCNEDFYMTLYLS